MSAPNQPEQTEQDGIERLVADVEQRQRNTTWPNVMTNASSADALMWHGSRRITKVQRVGVGIFGFLFVGGGVNIALLGGGFWLSSLIAAAFIGAGCKLLWNSVRRNDPPKATDEDESL